LRVVSARVSADRRTLMLTTDPHPQSVHYALTLPRIKSSDSTQPATIDLAYDLNGVEARWFADRARTSANWTGWLPHLDWQVSTGFTEQSSEHARLSEFARRNGTLQLRTQLSLPTGKATIKVEASAPFELTLGTNALRARSVSANSYSREATRDFAGQPEALTLNLETTADKPLALHAAYWTESDPTPRPLPFGSLLLPWAPTHQAPPQLPTETTELAGGDYEQGRTLFFGERLKCSSCHRLRGEGSNLGPDLSSLIHHDPRSVLRDIKEPSALINPDYVAYNVRLHDGGDITGFVRMQTADSLRVIASDGKEQFVPRNTVSDLRPSAVSMMPSGLLEGLKESQLRDLMTFLLHEPPGRSRAQVDAVLSGGDTEDNNVRQTLKPLHIVLVASKQDHGPGQHDYPAWQKKWTALLGQASRVTVASAWEWPSVDQFHDANVLVFYDWNHNWSAPRYQELDDYQARGGNLVMFHSATIADKEPEKLAARIGLAAQPGPTKYLHTPFLLNFVAPTNHLITRGFKRLDLLDEPYWPMIGDTNRVVVLATAELEGQARPLIWTFQKGKGRVFASIPGHYVWTFDDPLFRTLALRGLAWAVGEPMWRFDSVLLTEKGQ